MKKLLLASTALVMSAGVAAADVSVVGDGRMGVTYNSLAADEFAFTQRIRIRFNASGTTDTGLTFGGWVRAHDAGNGNAGRLGGGQNVFISGAFGRLSMGDVAGAAQTVVGDLHGVGLTGIGFFNETQFMHRDFGGDNIAPGAFFGAFNGGPNMLYTYSMSGFTFAFSMSQPAGPADVYTVGIGYAMDGLRVGLGYEYADTPGPSANHIALGASYDFGDFSVRATYGRANQGTLDIAEAALGLAPGSLRRDQYGVSGAYTFDAITASAYYRRGFDNFNNFGVGASYSLGGGASLVGGIVRRTASGAPNQTRADFGVSMSF
jgi:outer membrane protein OmpU